MIDFRYEEEKIAALIMAEKLGDNKSKRIIQEGVKNKKEAIYISKFFWAIVEYSASQQVNLPFEGSMTFWSEKLHHSICGHLENLGYDKEWDEVTDNT